MKSVSVNIVMTYPVHWTKYQVLRDFVQNFYDAVGYNDWRKRFCYEYNDTVCHMFGGDASASFSQALTFATELLLENQEKVIEGMHKWNQIFETDNLESPSFLLQ